MALSREDSELFFRLMMTLLTFVNRKKHVVRPYDEEIRPMTDPSISIEVAHCLWSDDTLIDAFLEENPQLPEEHQKILRSWKRHRQGKFILERHLKKGSVFISLEDSQVYLVNGITRNFEDIYFGARLPLMVTMTLLPFRDVIIPDGYFATAFGLSFGAGMKRMLKDSYMTAKKSGNIITSL
jgi:hypothetical protein